MDEVMDLNQVHQNNESSVTITDEEEEKVPTSIDDNPAVTNESVDEAPRTEKTSTSSLFKSVNFTQAQRKMFERLANNPDVIAKSQQRDEPDLSTGEKLEVLCQLFKSNPGQFLVRYGKYVGADDASCFDHLRVDKNYVVNFHLNEVEKSWKKGATEKLLKNRRYEALKKLVETTDYFSEEEMQRRNPILFEQLVGRYHTDDERTAFLNQSYKSSSGSGSTSTPLTDLFLVHLERTSDGSSCRRMAQEAQLDDEAQAEEYDSDEDYDMEEPSPSSTPKGKPTVNDEERREEIDDDEKEILKEEFFTTMYRNFLNGKDEDFDYSTVDDNPEYDCGENLENDEEEKYFDDEEPCEVSEPISDPDHSFRPPVRSSDIESKIEQLTVTANNCEKTGSPGPVKKESCEAEPMTDEEEDELDKYMKIINSQLKNS